MRVEPCSYACTLGLFRASIAKASGVHKFSATNWMLIVCSMSPLSALYIRVMKSRNDIETASFHSL